MTLPTNPSSQSDNPCGTKSLWMDVELPSFPALDANEHADICIVGAGIAGLTCAYTLAKEGKSIILIDRGAIASGQTSRTTAHLTWVLEERYFQLEKLFGAQGAKLAAQSHSSAIDYIESIVQEEKIECDFERVDGYLFTPPEDSQDILEKEFAAVTKTGNHIHRVKRAPFGSSFDTGPCLHFPRQAQFHILKYVQGLIQAILKYGGKIFSHTCATHFEEGPPCTVNTQSGFTITSSSVIVTTCTPVNNRVVIHTKQAAYRTYVVAFAVPKNAVPKGLYWDTADPYHYVRTQKDVSNPDLEWLIVGGEDHKTGQDQSIDTKHDRYDLLERWAKKRFLIAGTAQYGWSGEVFEAVDSLAFIGQNPGNQHIYIATGDNGNGMTHGTIAGMLIPDLILQKPNPWQKLYDPARKTWRTAPTFIHENLNTAWQYRDWLTPGEIQEIEEIPLGEGSILRKGVKKIAVYKDEDHGVHMHCAFCPHLGGCVRWNPEEKSWDCPCHGSRFDGCGNAITGPTIAGLQPYTGDT